MIEHQALAAVGSTGGQTYEGLGPGDVRVQTMELELVGWRLTWVARMKEYLVADCYWRAARLALLFQVADARWRAFVYCRHHIQVDLQGFDQWMCFGLVFCWL